MNEHQTTKIFSPDDHRITAYALGESSGAERAEVEAFLKNDPEARAAVQEIRAVAARLKDALEAEAAADTAGDAGMKGVEGLAKEATGTKDSRAGAGVTDDPYRKKVVAFPYMWVGTVAAACFAMVFAFRESGRAGRLMAERDALQASKVAAEAEAREMQDRRDRAALAAVADGDDRWAPLLVKDAEEFMAISAERGQNPNTEMPAAIGESDFARVRSEPLSTFAAEVATESYLKVRRYLDQGRLPPRDAVRVEEMVNYFSYRYTPPAKDVKEPFAASMEIAAAPWNPEHRLVRIGVKGREEPSAGQAGGETAAIAKDVKLQVEFNPAVVQAYRLLGYEHGASKPEGSGSEKAADGKIGAGHTVTALYEIVPVGASAPESTAGETEELKYQKTILRDARVDGAVVAEKAAAQEERAVVDNSNDGSAVANGELLTLKIRFKEPVVDVSRKMEIPVIDTGAAFEAASKDFKFAAAVASLGMMLREPVAVARADYDRIISWAEAGKGDDADGKRGEFIELVKKARTLSAE